MSNYPAEFLGTLGILISGRKLSVLGWLVMLTVWPIGWLIFGPEELP